MRILQETGSSQSISFVPREFPSSIDYIVFNESLKTAQDVLGHPVSKINGRMVMDAVFDLKEDTFYTLSIFNGASLIHRLKIFCTNQTDYNINNGQYVSVDQDINYITFGQ